MRGMSTLPHMKRMSLFISIIAELDHLLSQRLLPRDVSLSYPSIQTLRHHETILEESIDRMKTQGRKVIDTVQSFYYIIIILFDIQRTLEKR